MLEEFYQANNSADWAAFRSEGFWQNAVLHHPGGAQVTMAAVPPLLRTLLVTDGTVTKALEAFFWEPVNVCAQKLQVIKTEKPIAWMNSPASENVLLRQVILKGERSQNLYAKALSLVKLAELDRHLQDALIAGSVGIGVLLREFGMETYRELMAVDMEYGDDLRSIWVYRTYRIMHDKKPIILIRESFPWHLYEAAGK